MSYIGDGLQLTSKEVLTVQNLHALAVGGAGQAIVKTGAETFTNVTAGGGTTAWTGPEHLTLAGDSKTFILAVAPTAVITLYGGHQPQIYGVDFTGTIDGVNKTFAYVSAVDASIISDQYAIYL